MSAPALAPGRPVGGRDVAARLAAGVAVGLLVGGFVLASFARTGVPLNLGTVWEYRHRFASGFVMTVAISAGAMVLSLVIGVLAAAAQRSRVLVVVYLGRAYVQLIRGTPLLVQIYFFYYLIGTAWGLDNRYVAGVVILSLFEGAYIAEIVRGGWQSIEAHTFEVADALGLERWQTFRLVTLPILLARTVPALAGQFASIIKDSSLLSVIAVIELTQATQEVSAENFQMFANYFLLGALYFALTFPVSLFAGWLERRLGRAAGAA